MKSGNQITEPKKLPSYTEINRFFGENIAEFMNYFPGYSYIPCPPGDKYATYALTEFETELFLDPEHSSLNTNWKIHLSCHVDDLPKMWEVVLPILLKHHCAGFKCVKLYGISIDNLRIRNEIRALQHEQITLYVRPGEEERYNLIIEEIENECEKNNIKIADEMSETDRKVGRHTSVRFAGYGKPLSYIDGEKAIIIAKKLNLPAYNLMQVKDPFRSHLKEEQSLTNNAETIIQQDHLTNINSVPIIADATNSAAPKVAILISKKRGYYIEESSVKLEPSSSPELATKKAKTEEAELKYSSLQPK